MKTGEIKMKSLCIEKPDKLVLKEIPVPEYGTDEVLVRVYACGICMSDLEAIDGTRPEPYIKYPVVLGHEFSGTIERCGNAVKRFRRKDRVTVKPGAHCGICKYCLRGEQNFCLKGNDEHSEIGFTINGGFADYVVAHENQIFKIPDSVPLELGVLVEPGACVWTGIEATSPSVEDVVAVIGPGPIGLLAVNFYKGIGVSKVIIVGTRDERNELAKKVGATHAINPLKEAPLKSLLALTDGEGPDIVFESAGKIEAVRLSFDAVRAGGRVALAGVVGKGKKIALDSDYFIFKGVKVFGVLGYTPKTFDMSIAMLESHKEELEQIITHQFPLEEYKKAFEIVRNRKNGIVKAILKP